MGHNYTDFKGVSICARDWKDEVWMRLTVKVIDEMSDAPEWLRSANEYWRENAELTGMAIGDWKLDEFLTDAPRIKTFKKVGESVYRHLLAHGPLLTKNYLNELCGTSPAWDYPQDMDTGLYLRFGQALLRLVSGRVTETFFVN